MKPSYILRKIVREPRHVFGRFRIVRYFYSAYSRIVDRFRVSSPLQSTPRDGLLIGFNSVDAVNELRRDAVTHLWEIAPLAVEEIRAYALQADCRASLERNRTHRFSEVRDGNLDGQKIAISYVCEPDKCSAVREIVEHPQLRQAVRSYLGYAPRRIGTNLFWSHVNTMTLEERRAQYHTVEYHFDVHDLNFCYVHIYLTEVTPDSGAHVMVKGSHRRKPMKWLFQSARQSNDSVHGYYRAEDVLTISGPAGTGFIEDTSCYHKALAPVSSPRLMLQIRFH